MQCKDLGIVSSDGEEVMFHEAGLEETLHDRAGEKHEFNRVKYKIIDERSEGYEIESSDRL